MREIKFRAWDKDEMEMVTDEQIQTINMRVTGEWEIFHGSGLSGFLNGQQNRHRNIEIMQYTGLKDKNGKEIYEWDIVKGNSPSLMVIVPMYGGLSIHPVRNLGQQNNELIAMPTNDVQTASWLVDSEVIGNIYENHELIEKGESNGS